MQRGFSLFSIVRFTHMVQLHNLYGELVIVLGDCY